MSARRAKQNGKKILLIDDELSSLFWITQRLENWGFEVLTAEEGEIGLQMAEAEQPDLILLDVVMPKMKGREVCFHLKGNPKTKQIPVIFLTALDLPDHITSGLKLGAEDYITKPFEPEQLHERINVCLARHGKV